MLIKFKHLNLGYFVYNSAFLAPLMKIRQSGSSWPGTLWMGITGPAPRCSELFCSLCKPKAALVAVLFHWCLTEPASFALVRSVSSRFYHPVCTSQFTGHSLPEIQDLLGTGERYTISSWFHLATHPTLLAPTKYSLCSTACLLEHPSSYFQDKLI